MAAYRIDKLTFPKVMTGHAWIELIFNNSKWWSNEEYRTDPTMWLWWLLAVYVYLAVHLGQATVESPGKDMSSHDHSFGPRSFSQNPCIIWIDYSRRLNSKDVSCKSCTVGHIPFCKRSVCCLNELLSSQICQCAYPSPDHTSVSPEY